MSLMFVFLCYPNHDFSDFIYLYFSACRSPEEAKTALAAIKQDCPEAKGNFFLLHYIWIITSNSSEAKHEKTSPRFMSKLHVFCSTV